MRYVKQLKMLANTWKWQTHLNLTQASLPVSGMGASNFARVELYKQPFQLHKFLHDRFILLIVSTLYIRWGPQS